MMKWTCGKGQQESNVEHLRRLAAHNEICETVIGRVLRMRASDTQDWSQDTFGKEGTLSCTLIFKGMNAFVFCKNVFHCKRIGQVSESVDRKNL